MEFEKTNGNPSENFFEGDLKKSSEKPVEKPRLFSAPDAVLFAIGCLLLFMEALKQLFLYFVVFEGHYNVWYFPFQLCSVPMYLCIVYGILSAFPVKNAEKIKRIIATFVQDFGLLGGIAALLVPDGFTWERYPVLTLHGYLWHIILILLSIYIFKKRLSLHKKEDFPKVVPLFAALSCTAEFINIILSSGGADCDMFYISPFHISSQPVFCEIDLLIGRIPGIFVYLAAVLFGAFIIHFGYSRLYKLLH